LRLRPKNAAIVELISGDGDEEKKGEERNRLLAEKHDGKLEEEAFRKLKKFFQNT